MSGVARVLAQGKINLRLRVLAREASGYHSIETIFQRLEFGDDVVVRVVRGRSLEIRTLPFNTLGQTLMAEPRPGEREVFVLFPWDLVPESDWRSGIDASSACATCFANALT